MGRPPLGGQRRPPTRLAPGGRSRCAALNPRGAPTSILHTGRPFSKPPVAVFSYSCRGGPARPRTALRHSLVGHCGGSEGGPGSAPSALLNASGSERRLGFGGIAGTPPRADCRHRVANRDGCDVRHSHRTAGLFARLAEVVGPGQRHRPMLRASHHRASPSVMSRSGGPRRRKPRAPPPEFAEVPSWSRPARVTKRASKPSERGKPAGTGPPVDCPRVGAREDRDRRRNVPSSCLYVYSPATENGRAGLAPPASDRS